MRNGGARTAEQNGGNPHIPENVLLFSQGFQPQLQNVLPGNFTQDGQYFAPGQFSFPQMPGNFNFSGYLPGQYAMPQPFDAMSSVGCYPQPIFPSGRNFGLRQYSPLMMQNMMASSMLQPMGHGFMPWMGQNPWMNQSYLGNPFAQDMIVPWVPRMDTNQAINRFPDVVTIDDDIVTPKTENGDAPINNKFVEDLVNSKHVCSKHQKKSAGEGNDAVTGGKQSSNLMNGIEEAVINQEVTPTEKSKGNLRRSLREAVPQIQETPKNIVLIKSATTCNWRIKSGIAKDANPTTPQEYSNGKEPLVANRIPDNNAGSGLECIPIKKRKVSFWDRQPVVTKATKSKKLTNQEITEGMRVTKGMAQGILRASQPAKKSLPDGNISQNVCVLLEDCLSKDDVEGECSDSSDHSSKYCSSLCSCRCLTEESC